jgi:CelD/BcsL family acetyltransferase involved in cellulose biosynthesis
MLAYKKPRDLSYHNPLIIDTQFSPKKQRRIFKFELHWLDHSEFLPKIKDIWQGPTRDNSALSRVLLNWKRSKDSSKGGALILLVQERKGRRRFKNTFQKMEDMEESGPLNFDQIKHRIDLKVELLHILDEEELFWFKKCHEAWLFKGDNNTEFFHRIANGRRRKQTIF